MRRISESGVISASGQLLMPMERLNAFFAANPGKRVIARFEIPEPSSELQQAYYYNYIIPTIAAAMQNLGTRMNESAVDRFLIAEYPGCFATLPGADVTIARQLERSQMSDYLEWLRQYAAENLNIYIEDPKSL